MTDYAQDCRTTITCHECSSSFVELSDRSRNILEIVRTVAWSYVSITLHQPQRTFSLDVILCPGCTNMWMDNHTVSSVLHFGDCRP